MKNFTPSPDDNSVLAGLLRSAGRRRLLAVGRQLHRRLLFSQPNLVLYNHLLNLYVQCGEIDDARKVFDIMPKRNIVTWTALITGYYKHGFHKHCVRLLADMLVHHRPNEFGLSAAVGSCSRAGDLVLGRQVHGFASKSGLDDSEFVGNALITMYCNCGRDGIEDGWLVFKLMPLRSFVAWNSMIAGFRQNGQLDRSRDVFVEMYRCGVGFDRVTLVSVISSCSLIQHCQQLHCLTIKSSYDCVVEVVTVLVRAYSSLGGSARDCYLVFDGARDHDVMAWTGIMASLVEEQPMDVIILFCEFQQRGLKPDRYSCSIAVKASASLAMERHCAALHGIIEKSGFANDVVISNSLIHAYARCGNIIMAELIFEEMTVRDEVSWNSIIRAYATHGRAKEALMAFDCMDVLPDSTTFVGLLSACSHGGLVDEGRVIFQTMFEVYGIAPQVDHYACMVDILGRAGKLLEAEVLINEMPMEPDSIVWSALLGACKKHKDRRLAEKAAQKLMELKPHSSIGYVMMSNIYNETGNLAHASIIRKGMKKHGIQKELGLSWIEIENQVHEFSAGAHHHSQRKAIYAEVKRLADDLKEIGYVPDTRFVIHETEEEHKEERLLYHSEKLALAFALMKTAKFKDTLKIMKNLRICEDCHNFIKLASQFIGKEILVRDTNRFHHFVDGVCSCGDYW